MSDEVLIKKFIKELKHKIHIKSNTSIAPEKTLLESFKYYDFRKTGNIDYKTFTKMVKIKLSINIFRNEELMIIYDYFQNKFDSGKNSIIYREFVKDLYNVDVTLNSVRNDDDLNSVYSKTKSFTGNKYDVEDSSKIPRKLLNFIIYKLRKKSFSSFLKLYVEMLNLDQSESGFLSFDNLFRSLNKCGIDMKEDSVEKIYNFFQNKLGRMEYEKFWDFLSQNFNKGRKKITIEMFDKLDINYQKSIDINIIRELFNAKNYFDVKSQRKTIEEIQMGFEEYINLFPITCRGNTLLNQNKFLDFFKFISIYIEKDKHFTEFIDKSFRYYELKKYKLKNQSGFKSKIQNLDRERNGDVVSLRQNLRPGNILLSLEEQLSKKGNKGYINFFKSLKGNDFDRDGKLYLKEWSKTLKEQRINLEEKQISSIFRHYSGQSQKMNFELLLQKLIPAYNSKRIVLLKSLYEDLFKGESGNELTFYKLQNSFNSRGHPDFRDCLRADYEIKNEFIESLQTFLLNFQGNHISLSLFAFVRFFEFFARDWNLEFFEAVLENSFSQRARGINKHIKAPYGKDEEVQQKTFGKKTVSNSHRSKYYDEYKEEKKNHKPDYPYYTTEKNKNAFKKKNSQMDNYKENEGNVVRDINMPHIDSKRLERSRKSKVRRKEKDSIYSRNRQGNMMEAPNSPDNGSLLSYSKNEKSIYNLNKKIQDSMVYKDNRVYDNLNHSNKIGLNSNLAKLTSFIRKNKSLAVILEMEYELTNKSDIKGVVDYYSFSTVLKKLELDSKINMKDLYISNSNENDKLHVQAFANSLRGQMDEDKENNVIDLFEKLCSRLGDDIIKVDKFRKCFVANSFNYSKESNLGEISEMFEFMIDLFVCLNLSIKERDFFDLDDFLYFFDNFAFYIEDPIRFKNMLRTCFK